MNCTKAVLTTVLLFGLIPIAHSQVERWSIPVVGFGDATVVAPKGTVSAPIAVVIHGAWDRPEWACENFSQALVSPHWVLCLRGRLRSERPSDGARWTVGSIHETHAELIAALDALRAYAGSRATAGVSLLAGFSKGAAHAAQLASKYPENYPRVLLVEGGYGWTKGPKATAPPQKRAWACGTSRCAKRAAAVCMRVRSNGGLCSVATDLRIGHAYNPPFPKLGRSLVRWLYRASD